MEEHVGQLWHKLISRAAATDFPVAAVSLDEMSAICGIAFRAMGGDAGLQIAASHAIQHGARRGLLQRIAGSGKRVEYGWRDRERLYLPGRIALFPGRERNRELYLWLVALAAAGGDPPGDWMRRSGHQTQTLLKRFPGLKRRYRRLVEAHLALRPPVESLPPADRLLERTIRAMLIDPADQHGPIESSGADPWPVPLWLHPDPPLIAEAVTMSQDGDDASSTATTSKPRHKKRRKAERVDMPDGKSGLLLFRLESLFSWTEYLPLDRTTEESEDDERAEKAADDLDVMSVARSSESIAGTLRFDLDLPSEANDDIILGEGVPLPEWDYKKQRLQPDHCRLQPMLARASGECELPAHLKWTARRIRAQFEQLLPDRRWFNGEREGSELDLNGYITHLTDRINGHDSPEIGLYRTVRHGSRDMATLLLADLSLSTDSWVNQNARVIDIIRDSIFLFAEALSATGDRFAIHGFSSRRRDPIRFHTIKTFDEAYDGAIRGRIAALEPGYYTRMGAAIRYATRLFTPLPSTHRVLLLLTDGKPNDLDQYEGRYGIEDTRMAILEALRAGLHPFCVTIDDEAEAYLPYLFGASSYVLIRKADELPKKLLLLYARLTQGA